MYDLLAIVTGYLLGSIPFAFLTTRLFGVSDIRLVGSGNIGATNAWRAAGPIAGILVLILDVGKGIAAVFIASSMPESAISLEYLKLLAGIAAIIGHIFPIFMLFRGGKGVNTALGVMLTILPDEAIVALAVFVIAVVASRYISLGSILAAVVFFLITILEWILDLSDIPPVYVVVTFFLMILILVTHRSNIKRLLSGTENRFSFHSGKGSEVKSNG